MHLIAHISTILYDNHLNFSQNFGRILWVYSVLTRVLLGALLPLFCIGNAILTELFYGLDLRTGRGIVWLEKQGAAVSQKSVRANLRSTSQPVTKFRRIFIRRSSIIVSVYISMLSSNFVGALSGLFLIPIALLPTALLVSYFGSWSYDYNNEKRSGWSKRQ
jgi:hypothetical protein